MVDHFSRIHKILISVLNSRKQNKFSRPFSFQESMFVFMSVDKGRREATGVSRADEEGGLVIRNWLTVITVGEFPSKRSHSFHSFRGFCGEGSNDIE